MPAATPIATGADPTPSALGGQTPSDLAFTDGANPEGQLRFGPPTAPSPTATLKAVNDDPDANLREQTGADSTESAAAPAGEPDSSVVGTIAGVGGLAVLGAAGAALMIRRRQAVVATEASFEEQKPTNPEAAPDQ